MNPIRSKMFNFNKFVNNLGLKAFLDDNSTRHCDCLGSPFMDKVHNRIVKDNLTIIRNNKLRKLFFEGPKYRENRIDYQKAKESIITPINSCIQSWCDKHDITTPSFPEWKQAVILVIDEKFNHLSTKLTPEKLHRIKKMK